MVVPDGRKRVVAPQVWSGRFVGIKVVGVIPPVRHAATGVEGVAPGVLQRGVLRQLAQICAGDDVLQGGQMGRDVSCLRRAQPFRIRRQFQRLFADGRSRQRYAGRRHSCWCQIASSSLVLGRRRSRRYRRLLSRRKKSAAQEEQSETEDDIAQAAEIARLLPQRAWVVAFHVLSPFIRVLKSSRPLLRTRLQARRMSAVFSLSCRLFVMMVAGVTLISGTVVWVSCAPKLMPASG